MAIVHETIRIEADPRRVWDIVGNPARIADCVPSLASSTTQGNERRCVLEGGGVLVEQIVERSDADRFYEYEIVYAPLPLRSQRSRLTVQAHEGHAQVDWIAEFEPQEAGRGAAGRDVRCELPEWARGASRAARGRRGCVSRRMCPNAVAHGMRALG